MITQTKHCNTCDTTKTVDQFSKRRSSKDGLASQCKDCYRTYHKAHYEAHRERKLAKVKAHYEANREELLAKHAEYTRNRLANDPVFQWVSQTRTRLRRILHGTGSHQPTLDLLGCTGQEWRDHLEAQWTEGMSWDSYGAGEGRWQCDHVIPVSAFDQSDLEQRKKCWHYSNTQPLWAKDNMAKGATIPTESTNE